jgi:hypothetical protein
MFKKTLLAAICLGTFCFADNFVIGSQSGDIKEDSSKAAHTDESSKLPQRVVIEDINPSSELGQLVGVMLKNEQKKAIQAMAPKPKVKTTSVKKAAAKKDVHMEIKSEEASSVGEKEKKEAEHNENNSSLKKISSSNICD